MTLQRWADFNAVFIAINPETGAAHLSDSAVIDDIRRELWHLSDYRVSSVTGGSIWLIPKEESCNDLNVNCASDA